MKIWKSKGYQLLVNDFGEKKVIPRKERKMLLWRIPLSFPIVRTHSSEVWANGNLSQVIK